MTRRKITNNPALYGRANLNIISYPARRGRNPWYLLMPGIALSMLAAWIDGYIERPLILAILVVAAILLTCRYSRKFALGLVYALLLAAYALATHVFGVCC